METKSVQRFETGVSVNYLKHWTELHSVREFVQNVVYAKCSLGDNISITHDGKLARIHNDKSGFSRGKLLVGESEQSGVSGSPGEYGEGAKVAMMVARRLGLQCWIETNGFTVKPEVEPSAIDSSVQVLTFYVEDTNQHNGTTVFIECDKDTLEEATGSFVALQEGVTKEVISNNTIMKDIEGGIIYINGVEVYRLTSAFSYNFTNANLMNRDRSSVDIQLVKIEVSKLLTLTKDVEVAKAVVKAIMEDNSLLEALAPPQDDRYGIWKQAMEWAHNGKKKLTLSMDTRSNTQAEYKRYTVIHGLNYVWKSFCANQLKIPYADDLIRIEAPTTRVHRKATGEDSQTLGWAKRLVKLYYGDYGTVKTTVNLMDNHGNKCAGLYDREKDVIWLDSGLLHDKQETFTTLLHETIHRITGASDNTESFTRGWEKACWGILNRGAK